jgi:hypothetical protein
MHLFDANANTEKRLRGAQEPVNKALARSTVNAYNSACFIGTGTLARDEY